MSKFYCNGVWLGSDDSKDIKYDDTTVYEKLKEIESIGVGGGSGEGSGSGAVVVASSSFHDFSRTVTLERNGCCRVLQFKGETTLSKIILKPNDMPYRSVKSILRCERMDGTVFDDVLELNTAGVLSSEVVTDRTETVKYYGCIIWVVAVTESDTPILGSDNNIRYNAEDDEIQICKNGVWVAWEGAKGNTISQVVNQMPEDPVPGTLYIVVPETE